MQQAGPSGMRWAGPGKRRYRMPVKTKKVDGYRVSTPGGVKAKKTSKPKAEAQTRLLRGIEHGLVPRGRRKR